jgi:hypothetical protein
VHGILGRHPDEETRVIDPRGGEPTEHNTSESGHHDKGDLASDLTRLGDSMNPNQINLSPQSLSNSSNPDQKF